MEDWELALSLPSTSDTILAATPLSLLESCPAFLRCSRSFLYCSRRRPAGSARFRK